MQPGGIIAVNGFYNNFNVAPIQMVTIVSTLKREKRDTEQQELYYKKSNTDFAGELEKAMDDLAPTDIHTVTYNSKSQLQPFFYAKRREYTI